MPDTFRCTLVTPDEQVLDEQVVYASIPAWDGQLGLMAQRAPLVAQLGDGPMRLDYADGKSRWFFLAGGFAQMKENQLSLMTEEALPAEQINRQQVDAQLQEVQANLPTNEEQAAQKQRRIRRAQILLQLLEHSR